MIKGSCIIICMSPVFFNIDNDQVCKVRLVALLCNLPDRLLVLLILHPGVSGVLWQLPHRVSSADDTLYSRDLFATVQSGPSPGLQKSYSLQMSCDPLHNQGSPNDRRQAE